MAGESTRVASSEEVDGPVVATDRSRPPVGAAAPRQRLLWWGAIVVLVCGVLGFGAFKVLRQGGMMGPPNLSGEIVPVEDTDAFFDRSFGLGRFDEQHPDGANFSFNYLRGRATVEFGAWGVDTLGEVQIAVNGTVIGSVRPTGGAWKYGQSVELPRNLLRPGPENVVSFRQTKGDSWEVGYLRIRQDPLLPPNPEEADAQMQLGRKLREDRDVEPSNLWNAMLKFRLAADLLELAQPRPAAYQEAATMVERINEELNEVFRRGRFSAEREYRFGNLEAARQAVRYTASFFPDHKDVRYRELSTYLRALEESE